MIQCHACAFYRRTLSIRQKPKLFRLSAKAAVGTFPRSIIDINIFVWISVYILPDKLQHFFAPALTPLVLRSYCNRLLPLLRRNSPNTNSCKPTIPPLFVQDSPASSFFLFS